MGEVTITLPHINPPEYPDGARPAGFALHYDGMGSTFAEGGTIERAVANLQIGMSGEMKLRAFCKIGKGNDAEEWTCVYRHKSKKWSAWKQ